MKKLSVPGLCDTVNIILGGKIESICIDSLRIFRIFFGSAVLCYICGDSQPAQLLDESFVG